VRLESEEHMISSVKKDKIPGDYAFVLKTSQLEELIARSNIKTDITLTYWRPQIIGSIFEAHFWLPNNNVFYNRLYIRAGILLKKDVSLARKALQKEILPEFEQWIRSTERLPEASPLYKEHYFNGSFIDGQVLITTK